MSPQGLDDGLSADRTTASSAGLNIVLLCWRDSGHPQGGGSERYLEEIGARLAAQGHHVWFRTAAYPGAARSEWARGMRFSRGGGRLSVYPRAWLALAAARWGRGPLGVRPDVVVDTQNGVPFFARLWAGAPVVLLEHHCHREQWPVAGRVLARVGWWIESWLSPRLHRRNAYVTVSGPSREELVELGVDPARITVVRNGVNAVPEGVRLGSAEKSLTPRLVALSRLVPHKRLEDALQVLLELREQIPGLQLDIIGDGWWRDELERRAAELGVAGAVTFHGHVPEARKYELLQRGWVHLMPSEKEGWGLAVVESAQVGTPTIGYYGSRGLRDSIQDGRTGLLVADLAELTAATGALLGDAQTRLEMGEAARRRAEGFSWDTSAREFLAVLEDQVRLGGSVPRPTRLRWPRATPRQR